MPELEPVWYSGQSVRLKAHELEWGEGHKALINHKKGETKKK